MWTKTPFPASPQYALSRFAVFETAPAAMNGGDDFRIVYVVPISKYETFRHDFQTFSIIGHLAKPEVGTVVVTPEGAELPLHAQGWKENE